MTTAHEERIPAGEGMDPRAPSPAGIGSGHDGAAEPSIGDLVEAIGQDVSGLLRTEIELAKAELKEESAKAGKAAGMLGGAGYAGHMVALFGSLTVTFAIGSVIPLGWAALIVTALWAAVGAALYVSGRAG
ncbi:phage holin family protein [Streptomyces sp. NPDC097619]|uniref:phage holin family protein n=1 Tax=Streptomyces sp. NPDC097619 TaxID=3157228 RepID=UPI003328CEA7